MIVDFATEAQVSGRDEEGQVWRARPEEVTILPRSPGLLSPFPAVRYRGEALEWIFGTGTLGLGGKVTNRGAARLCLRFDEARVASNAHPGPVALRVSSWRSFADGRWSVLGDTKPARRSYFVPPPLCLEPAGSADISFAPDLGELYPSRKMFDVSWPEGEPNLTQRGAGNWIAISLPLERAGKREALEVKLIETDSRARISYY